MSTNSTGSPYTPGAQDPQASPYGTDPRPAGAQPPAAPAPKKSRGLAIATIVGAALSVVLLVVTIVLVVGARSRNDEARNLDAQASQLEHQAVEIKAQKVCDAITRDKRNTAASLFRAYPDAHQDIASAMQRLCGDKYKTAKAVAQVSPADDDVFSYGSISCGQPVDDGIGRRQQRLRLHRLRRRLDGNGVPRRGEPSDSVDVLRGHGDADHGRPGLLRHGLDDVAIRPVVRHEVRRARQLLVADRPVRRLTAPGGGVPPASRPDGRGPVGPRRQERA